MKTLFLATAALLIVSANTHAAPRKFDPFTDGSLTSASFEQLAVRNVPTTLAEEQFRTVAVRKTAPYIDGALRGFDPYAEGAPKPTDAFTDGA